jgi:pimeloyl-ACP methyl ester carboxylesterase
MSLAPFGQDRFISVNDLQIHYVEWGSPDHPAVVLLHGFQSNAHTWDTFSCALSDTYRILALDQRGHGDTSWAPDGDYTPDAFIHDIVGFMDALNLRSAPLIGHSMGGRHAAMMAADHPDRVTKVVIVDTAAELPAHLVEALSQEPESDHPSEPEAFDSFEEVVRNGMAQYPLTPESELRHANYHNLYRGADGKWRWRWDLTLLERRRLNRSLRLDLYPYLQRIQCPTLLMRGQKSPLLTQDVAQKMVQHLSHGRWIEIPDAAHTVNADNAYVFNTMTAAFLLE